MAGGKKSDSRKMRGAALGESAVRSAKDRPDDPLFVSPPDIEGLALEGLSPGGDVIPGSSRASAESPTIPSRSSNMTVASA